MGHLSMKVQGPARRRGADEAFEEWTGRLGGVIDAVDGDPAQPLQFFVVTANSRRWRFTEVGRDRPLESDGAEGRRSPVGSRPVTFRSLLHHDSIQERRALSPRADQVASYLARRCAAFVQMLPTHADVLPPNRSSRNH